MLLDDDLYCSSSSTTTAATAPFSPSQFTASPNPAESSDGYRITWGPSAGSILADISKLRNNAVSSVKRTSANAGLASPTRQGAAGLSSFANNNIQPLRNWVPQQQQLMNNKQENAATAYTSKTAAATSRFSKRRRRYPSGSILATDCDRVGSSSSSSAMMEIDDSTLNPDTLNLFEQLQKRLEAKTAAAQAEREAEKEKEKENNIKRQQQSRKEVQDSRDKGKGRASVCSPILELSEKSHSTQSQQQAKDTSSNRSRQALQPKHDNNGSRPPSQQSNGRAAVQGKLLSQDHNKEPLCSTPKKALKTDTYRIPSQPIPSSPIAGPNIHGHIKRHGLERKTSSSTSVVPDSQEGPVLLVSNASKSPDNNIAKEQNQNDDDDMGEYWNDEEDKSLEMEMSQMTFPAAVSASQAGGSQATALRTTKSSITSACEAKQDQGGAEGKTWGGFTRRDRRQGNAASAASGDSCQVTQEEEEPRPRKSSGGLSSKPLARVAVPTTKPVKPAAVPQKTTSAQPQSAKPTMTSDVKSTANLKFSGGFQPAVPAVKKATSVPVMPTTAKQTSSSTTSRVISGSTAPRGLSKTPSEAGRFKPPTIVNKQKSLAAKEKFVKTVGVVQIDDLLDGVDFDDDSF